ncbi:hypothetical protein OAF16_01330 [Flavobacteriales bacterium]|nr:hypothetical protein [Flavobacteriales bacterium]
MRKINIILAIVVSCLLSSCSETDNNQQEENKEVEVLEKQVFGLLNNNGSYVLDTSVILSNQNLTPLILELEKANLESKLVFQEAPKIVRSLLDSLTGDFDMANPGVDWEAGCVKVGKYIEKKISDSIFEVTFVEPEIPDRKLVYLGTSDNITLMTYYTSGTASAHTLIIKHDNQEVFDLWKGSSKFVDPKINKTEIIEYLKQNQNKRWGLNRNILYL